MDTREKIKEALLEAVSESSFLETSITKICKIAEIHRSTFYTYYGKKEDVLNELLYDALEQVDSFSGQLSDTSRNRCKLPLCIFIRESKKYHPLFRDPALSDYIIGKMVMHFQGEAACKNADKEKHIKRTAASLNWDDLLWFQMYGCFHMTIKYLDSSSEIWEQKKATIDQLMGKTITDSTL